MKYEYSPSKLKEDYEDERYMKKHMEKQYLME